MSARTTLDSLDVVVQTGSRPVTSEKCNAASTTSNILVAVGVLLKQNSPYARITIKHPTNFALHLSGRACVHTAKHVSVACLCTRQRCPAGGACCDLFLERVAGGFVGELVACAT